jgi:hypothetical protein
MEPEPLPPGSGAGGDSPAAPQARNMEQYSLISLQPLGNTPAPGQPVRTSHVRWLRSRGLNANLAELVSLKCDDLANRERLRADLLQEGTPGEGAVPERGASESLLMLQAWLLGLGLDVELAGHDGHVDLAVRPARTEEVVARSSGLVRQPETIDYRTHDDIEGGLFCPAVFGPSRGQRRRRFGHVALPVPVVPLLWRTGSPSVLERLLDLPAATIEQIVHYKATVDWTSDPVSVDANPPEPPAPLGEQSGGPLSGGAAIGALLLGVPEERLPPALRGRADALLQQAVLIVPPDLRPLVLLDSGNFATHDVNDLYRRLLNRRNRLAKLVEPNAPAPILADEARHLQEAADAVWANRLLPKARAVPGAADRRLRDCLDMVVGQLLDQNAKRVDWSGRARVVAHESVPPGRARVPRRIVEELRLRAAQPVLLTADDEDGTFVAVLPEAHDEGVLMLAAEDFDRLGLGRSEVPTCLIHRPLGRAACAEAARLRKGDPGPVVEVPEHAGWVDGGSAEEVVAGLIEAALGGEPVCLETPRGLLVGGTGAVEAPADPAEPDEGGSESEPAKAARKRQRAPKDD